MKRLLVPVDFSPQTETSCRYALALALESGAELILFHSFFDQLYFSDGGFSTSFESGIMLTDEIILDFYRQKEKKLEEIASELKSQALQQYDAKVTISCKMESGDPEVQIIHAIQLFKPEMIVMGSTGMGKKGLFSGSVARRIIEHSNIPVIAVPDIKDIPTLKNVAYMTNFIPADCQAILDIDHILSPLQINIFCLHLLENETEAAVQKKIKQLSEDSTLAHIGSRITYHTAAKTEEQQSLKNFMELNKIDLIAFIPNRRNILKNIFYQGITKEDLFLTRIPIMALRQSTQYAEPTDA